MIKVNCLACGHNVVLADDYADYTGLVKCFACSALLGIKTEEGQIKAVSFIKIARADGTETEADEALEAAFTSSVGITY